MNRTFLVKTAVALICFWGLSESLLAVGDFNQDRNILYSLIDKDSSGPVDELISILEKYSKQISESKDKDVCDSLQTELSNKIDDLDKKYPGYEPNSQELSRIENAFMQYIDVTDSSGFFDDAEDYDEEEYGVSLDMLETIYNNYSSIEDIGQKFLAITEDYTNKISASEDLMEIIELSNQYTGLLENYFDDFEPSDSEKTKYEEAINKLGAACNAAVERAVNDNE